MRLSTDASAMHIAPTAIVFAVQKDFLLPFLRVTRYTATPTTSSTATVTQNVTPSPRNDHGAFSASASSASAQPKNQFAILIFLLFFADFGVLGDARIPEMKKSRVCTQETGGGDSSPNRAVRTGKIPRKMRVSLRCPYGRMTYTGSNGRQNALSAVQPSPTAPIADDTIVLPIIPIPVKFVNIFLLFSP